MNYKRSEEREHSKRGRILEVSFPGGRIEDGRIKADRGFYIDLDKKNGGAILRKVGSSGPGIVIEPCECALEKGGSCVQVVSDIDGQINEIWCEDESCGFCVGGVAPEPGYDFSLRVVFATMGP